MADTAQPTVKSKVHKPCAMAIVTKCEEGQVLVLIGDYCGTDGKARRGECGLPSGKIKTGETPEQAICREGFEELGNVPIALLASKSPYHLTCREHHVPVYGALARVTDKAKPLCENNEMRNFRWLTVAAALALPNLSPRSRDMLEEACDDLAHIKAGIESCQAA